MKKIFLINLLFLTLFFSCANLKKTSLSNSSFQFIRQATFTLTIGSKKILVDPVLSKQGELDPIPFSNDIRNPKNKLPISAEKIINNSDAILITHYHPDHFDTASEILIPKNKKIFCQQYDLKKLISKGFTNVTSIKHEIEWENIKIKRFSVRHHKGATGAPPFGESSSFSISNNEKTIFVTGDAILDSSLEHALTLTNPDFIVANTGECSFSIMNPVLPPGTHMTLTKEELISISEKYNAAKIIAIHMDAINHCSLSKEDLKRYVSLQESSIQERFKIPNEGKIISLN
ncbi:MBL fold metallo-hydrolase [Tenacibaculum xiamenense]|uniref:MBL fold metallo-hydrolase n=1 Tax=Tenacibaculum xiamenense TaxID=1261553 RepID=UPI003894AE7A